MVNQLTIAQQLRNSVKLVKPELLAKVPDDYSPRQSFNYLRHRATNYEELLEQQRQRYGDITPAENKALTQGAADVIIQAFREENIDLLSGRSNTPFARFARSLAQLLGLESGVDLEMIYEATKTLKRSQAMYKSWNERYRRQKNLVLKVIEAASPEIRQQVRSIYKANSKAKLEKLEEKLSNA
ncbi:MAG: hypothetical protein WBD47_21425 [Phormidesmis sp.]